MQAATGSDTPDIENHNHRLVISDLITLAERIEVSMKALERTIAGELPRGNPDIHDNVFVLDDVTPCYAKASAALHACHVALGEALHLMQGTPASVPGADRLAQNRGRGAGCT